MSFDPQLQQAIAAHMQYLRDLGIYDFYRRDTDVVIEPTPEEPVIPPRQPVSPQPPVGSFVAPPSRIEALRAIQLTVRLLQHRVSGMLDIRGKREAEIHLG